ncbi:MAG: hypothetical protein OEZ06_25355 [Myxococcales bacterium]|nr:hypothetical protein [Myxococcales bacterium]
MAGVCADMLEACRMPTPPDPLSPSARPITSAWPLALLVGAACIAAVAWPALRNLDASGFGDWQQFHHWSEVARVAWLRHREAPLWNPYHCGGVPHYGNPQAQFLAATFWLSEGLFGSVLGHKLFMLLHYAAAFFGTLLFLRPRLGQLGALLAAIIWSCGGVLAWKGAGGHSALLCYGYLPLLLRFGERARHDRRHRVAVALLLTLVLLEGGFAAAPFMILAWLLHLASDIRQLRDLGDALRSALVALGLATLMSAVRWVPVLIVMLRHPRRVDAGARGSLADLLHALSAREPHAWDWGRPYVWAEYGAYVGWIALSLAALGLWYAAGDRRQRPALIGTLFFSALALGNVGSLAPWTLLHRLPVFDHMQVPSRMHVFVAFYLAWLAGLALFHLEHALRARLRARPRLSKRTRAAALTLLATVAVDICSNSQSIHADRWKGPGLGLTSQAAFYLRDEPDYKRRMASYPGLNLGTPRCYDPVPWSVSQDLWLGPLPQLRIEPKEAGQVLGEVRTANTLRAQVRLLKPARLVWNQNADPDWRFSSGRAAVDRGRLALDLPAGNHRIDASYRPADLPWSALTSLLGLVLGYLLFRRGRRVAVAHSARRGDAVQIWRPSQ